MVSAENAWLTPSIPSPSNTHRAPHSHNPGHLGPQNLDHRPNPRPRNPALVDPLLRDPSTQIRDQSSDLPRSVPNLPILATDQPRVTKPTSSEQRVRTCEISPTDSTETEDELTAQTLSSITAAISTIKELKRESQEIVEASAPAKKTSIAVTRSEGTPKEGPTSTFYLPKPGQEIQFPAVANSVESEATLPFHQHSNTSSTTFYLPPPTPEITSPAQVASSTTVSLSEPTLTPPLSSVTSTGHQLEPRSRQSTEIPVIFVKTEESKDSGEQLFKLQQPEQLVRRHNQQHQDLSAQEKHQQQLDQHHQQHHLQEQQQSKKQKKQEDSTTIFHVPLESETANVTTGVGGIETLVPATSGISTTPQTLASQFFPSIFPQTSSLLTTFRSQTTTETTTVSTAISSTATTAAKTAVFYDTPVIAPPATKASGTTTSGGGDGGSVSGYDQFEPCEIGLEERLLQTAPIWYLPDLHRLGAVHLLQAQRVGTFIVRQSSKPNTLAITVRLPPCKGPHIEHYLIEVHHGRKSRDAERDDIALNADAKDLKITSPGDARTFTDVTNNSGTVKSSSTTSSTSSSNVVTYSLEASDNRFESVSALIARYATCCDELPVQLELPARLQEVRTRKELHSLALLGQEYWRTVGAAQPVGAAVVPTSAHLDPVRPTKPPGLTHSNSFNRCAEQSGVLFSSFGKKGMSASNGDLLSPLQCSSENSPLPSLVSLHSAGSSAKVAEVGVQKQQHLEGAPVTTNTTQPLDRSSLHLNLAPLDEILKEPPTFLSFKGGSQNTTPVSKPQPPPRISPSNSNLASAVPHTPTLIHPPPLVHTPTVAHTPTLTLTGVLQSPTIVQLQASSVLHSPSTSGPCRFGPAKGAKSNGNPPIPPPRWAKSSISTPNPSGTITTTLTFPVNQVKELPLQTYDENHPIEANSIPTDTGAQKRVHDVMESSERLHQASKIERVVSVQKKVEVSTSCTDSYPSSFLESINSVGVTNRNRDQLDLLIRQNFASPQSTPCTPCNPTTPLSTPMSEEGGENRAKLRKSHKDRRRYSNHYHDVNVIDNPQCYRSSLADKISDYEDVWSTPPREIPSSTSSRECPSPKKISRKSSFKPNAEISKSLGDLSDISQAKSSVFACDDMEEARKRTEANGNSFDSIPFRNTNSPFYVEPADCIREEEKRARIKKTPSNRILSRRVVNRYSDSNIQWKSKQNTKLMSKIESNENLSGFSSSAENILLAVEKENIRDDFNLRKHNKNAMRRSRGKPVVPPRVSSDNLSHGSPDDANRPPWRLDNSWRYQHCDNVDVDGTKNANSGSPSSDARFPLLETTGECDSLIVGEKTVIDLITEKLPDLPMPDTQSISPSAVTKLSEYDNVAGRYGGHRSHDNNNVNSNKDSNMNYQSKISSPAAPCLSSSISDSGTEFSEPWDSRKWDSLLQTDDESSIEPISLSGTPARPQLEEWERRLHSERNQANRESGAGSEEDSGSVTGMPILSVPQSRFLDSSIRSKILSPQLLALRHRKDAESGDSIREYSLQLGSDSSSMFAQNIEQFIKCTLETSEKDPEIVVRNVRQFMSGMKNYLVTSGEKQFEDIVKKERSNLKPTEFLNMDAILEDVLVRLVLRRLWHHITALYVNAYTANDSIQRLANNMTLARSLQPSKLGIRVGLSPPKGLVLDQLKRLLVKMQRVYAPREKLELLLTTISLIYHTLSESAMPFTGDADDLVPMIMWVLSHTGFFSAEIEADYMSGLLLTSASCGEAKYYLTAFHSAIHSLKHLAPSPDSTPGNSLDSVKQDSSVISEPGTLKIVVPDEKNGSIVTRTLPVRPTTTTREVCKMMAHKMRVTNPQDYGLYKLVDGYGEYCESVLNDHECPQRVRNELSYSGQHCIIAFKRTDAKIAWPMVKE